MIKSLYESIPTNSWLFGGVVHPGLRSEVHRRWDRRRGVFYVIIAGGECLFVSYDDDYDLFTKVYPRYHSFLDIMRASW